MFRRLGRSAKMYYTNYEDRVPELMALSLLIRFEPNQRFRLINILHTT